MGAHAVVPSEAARRAPWSWTLLGVAICLLLVGYFTLPLDEFGPERPVFSWTSLAVALVVLSLLLIREIQRLLEHARRGRPALGILLLVCLSLVIFANAYYALARHHGEFHGLHTRLDALYFTVITVSTVGFGDIAPAGQAARAVVIIQIAYNFVFLAAAASALSAQIRGRVAERAQNRGPRSRSGRSARSRREHKEYKERRERGERKGRKGRGGVAGGPGPG